jgi:ribosome modulation factor
MNRTLKTAVAAPQLHGEGQPQYVHLARGWTRKDIRKLRIFEKGWNAARDGRTRDQNPFSQKWSHERRNAWDDGYRCFQQARRGQLAEFEFARDQNARDEACENFREAHGI